MNTNDPVELYRRANTAAAEAIRFRRDPNGGFMAKVRQRDADALRSRARALAAELPV